MSQTLFEYCPQVSLISQGDIFRVMNGQILPGAELYLILTKDCDIANQKHRNYLHCLPIDSLDHYFENEYCPAKILKWMKKYEAAFLKTHGMSLSPEDWQVISKDDAVESAFLAERNIAQGDNLADWLAYGQCCRFLNRRHSSVSAYLHTMHRKNKPASALTNELKSHLNRKSLPDDRYFLPELPGQEAIGYIVDLRQITSVPIGCFHTDLAAVRSSFHNSDVSLLRVGRLKDYIRFSIIQMATRLIAKVGLETVFEQESEAAIQLSIENIVERANAT